MEQKLREWLINNWPKLRPIPWARTSPWHYQWHSVTLTIMLDFNFPSAVNAEYVIISGCWCLNPPPHVWDWRTFPKCFSIQRRGVWEDFKNVQTHCTVWALCRVSSWRDIWISFSHHLISKHCCYQQAAVTRTFNLNIEKAAVGRSE